MRRDDFSFSSEDGLEIAYYRWRAPGKAAGIVQIAHGMGEHSLRYAHVAEFLNQSGFHVYANDHRGHGRSAKGRESLGDFGRGGWNGLVADMVTLTHLARTREGRLPVILLGHSMGSFAAQQYVLDNSALIAGLVLSGSAAVDKLAIDPSQEADLTAFNRGFRAGADSARLVEPRSGGGGCVRGGSALRIWNQQDGDADDGGVGEPVNRSGGARANSQGPSDLHFRRRQGPD